MLYTQGRAILSIPMRGFTTRIVDLSAAESRSVLDMLFRHIDSTPKLSCRVHWTPRTLIFWDNLCTQHHAIWDTYPHSRVGGRVSLLGEVRPSA